ncbi:MAG: tetratricopeptide repeat protein [Nitrospirota bacterium]|nr:tetratricopeptide repeat protein [Nitrospirota bacterium]
MLNIKIRAVFLCAGMVVAAGCATSFGPLATLPMTSPVASNYNLEGIKHFNSGQWEEAKVEFERAVQADANLAEAHFNLALSLHKIGQHDEAKQEFKISGELAPKSKQIVDAPVYRNHLGLSSTFERHISGGYRY